ADVTVKTLTANTTECLNNCPAKPLAQYAAETNAYAGMNGTYLCPPDYAACAGKVNSYDYAVYNSTLRRWLNYNALNGQNGLLAFNGTTTAPRRCGSVAPTRSARAGCSPTRSCSPNRSHSRSRVVAGGLIRGAQLERESLHPVAGHLEDPGRVVGEDPGRAGERGDAHFVPLRVLVTEALHKLGGGHADHLPDTVASVERSAGEGENDLDVVRAELCRRIRVLVLHGLYKRSRGIESVRHELMLVAGVRMFPCRALGSSRSSRSSSWRAERRSRHRRPR